MRLSQSQSPRAISITLQRSPILTITSQSNVGKHGNLKLCGIGYKLCGLTIAPPHLFVKVTKNSLENWCVLEYCDPQLSRVDNEGYSKPTPEISLLFLPRRNLVFTLKHGTIVIHHN